MVLGRRGENEVVRLKSESVRKCKRWSLIRNFLLLKAVSISNKIYRASRHITLRESLNPNPEVGSAYE